MFENPEKREYLVLVWKERWGGGGGGRLADDSVPSGYFTFYLQVESMDIDEPFTNMLHNTANPLLPSLPHTKHHHHHSAPFVKFSSDQKHCFEGKPDQGHK